MGLAAAERCLELENPVPLFPREASKHVFEKGLEATRQVRRGEEAVGIPVNRRHSPQLGFRLPDVLGDQIVGQGTEVEREDIFGEVVGEHVGMQCDAL